jgi:hypothetical protein
MITKLHGKVFNEGGELVGEGACDVDEERGAVTLRPAYNMPALENQHTALRLELEDGSELALSHRVIKLRVNRPDAAPASVYRLFFKSQQPLVPLPRAPLLQEQGTGDQEQGPGMPRAQAGGAPKAPEMRQGRDGRLESIPAELLVAPPAPEEEARLLSPDELPPELRRDLRD